MEKAHLRVHSTLRRESHDPRTKGSRVPAGIHRFPQTEVKGSLLLVRQEPWPQTASFPRLSMECFDKLGISQGHSSILHSCREGRCCQGHVFLFYTSSSTITGFLKRPKLWEDVVRCCMYLLWLYVPQAAADMVACLNLEGVTQCVCQSSWPQRPFRVGLWKAPHAHPCGTSLWLGFWRVSAVLNRN